MEDTLASQLQNLLQNCSNQNSVVWPKDRRMDESNIIGLLEMNSQIWGKMIFLNIFYFILW